MLIDVNCVSMLRLGPGDVLLITAPHGASEYQMGKLRDVFLEVLPEDARVIVRPFNVGVEVISPHV